MKPGYVNFFDGMRVSAEHMDHLQGSLHSAIGDLRGIAGPGRVQEGFEVLANADGTLTVQPGLAFDHERNRVVSEEPRLVTPAFPNGSRAAYVCAEYASTSTGIVDDVPTLVWDGCRIVVRTDAPTPAENQIPLARVRLAADGVALEVETLALRRGAPGSTIPPAAGANSAPADGGGSMTGAYPAGAVAMEPAGTPSSAFAAAQGILRVTSPEGGLALSGLADRIAESTGASTRTGVDDSDATVGGSPTGPTVTVPAGRVSAPLPFLWRSVSCRTLLRLSWGPGGEEGSAAPGPQHLLLGEATYGPDGIRQHSVQTHFAPALAGLPLASIATDALGLVAIDRVPAPDPPLSTALAQLLARLEWRLWVTADTSEGLAIESGICWKGGTDEQAMRALVDSPTSLVWEATLAWKAVGLA